MLDGVRVLDMSRLLPGPACTWYLAGMGAQVIRVEPCGGGDPARTMPPFLDGTSAFFSALSAGDRSVALDLRHPDAPAALDALVRGVDVLVEGFKPGVLEELGFAPERIARDYPRLIVARLSGYGQTGPWRDRPGHDVNYLGLSGLVAAAPTHDGAGPEPFPVQVADLGGALVAAMGVCAALVERARTGMGRVLDVSLAEAALSMNAVHVAAHSTSGRDPVPGQELLSGGLPVYGTYRCSDGKLLTVGALEPKFQSILRDVTGSVEREALKAVFATKTRDEWVEHLAGACVGPALAITELEEHPQHVARRALERVGATTFVRPPFMDASASRGPVPKLGEHTAEVFAEVGVDDDVISGWRAAGLFG